MFYGRSFYNDQLTIRYLDFKSYWFLPCIYFAAHRNWYYIW